MMFKIAPEGYPFILIFALLTLVTLIVFPFWFITIPFVLTLFMVYFFRDPQRDAPVRNNTFYAPADGKVIFIGEAGEGEMLKGRALEVSIFMSAFNVHVNRSPCNATVKDVQHYPGRFIPAFHGDASLVNEHITMLLATDHGDIVVRQVAGLMARRAVCRVKPGERLEQGQRFGIIKFSSRVDVYLPLNTEVKVQLNDAVKAGETVIGVVKE